MTAISASQRTESSMAFFRRPLLRFVNVTWRLRSSGIRLMRIFLRPIFVVLVECWPTRVRVVGFGAEFDSGMKKNNMNEIGMRLRERMGQWGNVHELVFETRN